jgi:hypothetical protein|nr:MAG TPA: hypothetical protein [Caudoviricetes sp.]
MAINLLNKYTVSKEEQVLEEAAEITADESAQLAEDHATLREEQEALVQDVENTSDDIETAQTAVDQLQEQNEAITEVAESGEMTPAAAAGFELARRATLTPLGLDEETQTQAVDEAGLESMVNNKGVVALEQNQQIIVALEGAISDAFANFKKKAGAFLFRVGKMLSILNKRYKEAYKVLKETSDEEFNAKVEKLSNTSGLRNYLDNGKLVEIKPLTQAFDTFLDESSNLVLLFERVYTEYVRASNDEKVAVNHSKLAQIDEQFIGDVSKILDRLVKHSADVQFGNIHYNFTKTENGLKAERKQGAKYAGPASFTRQNLLDALNMGALFENSYKFIKSFFDEYEKSLNLVETNTDNKAAFGYQPTLNSLRVIGKTVIQVYNDLEAMREDYINFAMSFKKDN